MRLDVDRELRLVRQTRTARSYEDAATLRRSLGELVAQMHGIVRAEYVLLQDMRASRGRNDPEFEQTISRERARMSGEFRKLAVLVQTQVGRLQVQRLLSHSERPERAFLDEAEAIRWLCETCD